MRQPRMGEDVLRLQGRDEVLRRGGWGYNGGEEKCSVPNVKKKSKKKKRKVTCLVRIGGERRPSPLDQSKSKSISALVVKISFFGPTPSSLLI